MIWLAERIQTGCLVLVADKRMSAGTDSHTEQRWRMAQGQGQVGGGRAHPRTAVLQSFVSSSSVSPGIFLVRYT